MSRLFVALQLTPPLLQELQAAQAYLQKRFGNALRLTTPEQLHLTLKFIGEAPDEVTSQLSEALQATCDKVSPFEISLSGLGAFPEQGTLRIAWAGCYNEKGELLKLYDGVSDACTRLGFPPEQRPFSPHITIARSKESISCKKFAAVAQQHCLKPLSQMVCDAVLMRSDLQPSGSIHSVVGRFPLKNMDTVLPHTENRQ